MKRFYPLFLLILLTLAGSVYGQQTTQPSGEGFTLEKCIQYALENSVAVKDAAIDERIADAQVKETRGIGLPQINGTVQLMHNAKLQRFFNTYQVAQAFSGGTLPEFAGVEPTDIVGLGSPFQLKNSGDASLSINQILFNGSYLVGLKAAATYRELSERSSVQTKEQTFQQVTKAYYGVLINRDRLKLFDNNIARIEVLLKTTQAMHENGFVEAIDVDRIKVSLNNLIVERDKFQNLQEISLLLLKFQMNYPMEQPLNVEGDLATLSIDEDLLEKYSASWDYKQRADYRLLETNRDLQQLNLRNKYAASLPSLSAFATLGYSTQSPTISGLFKTNTPMDDYETAEGSIGPDKWYDYSMFGLTLNIPIFSGLQRNYQVQQAKLSLLKVENQFQQLNAAIAMEVKQAAITYQNSVKSLKSQEENQKLADNVARVTKIKYEEGVGSNIEVIDAEASLREAQINYYNALYDALVAKVDLDKAYGKLTPPVQEEK